MTQAGVTRSVTGAIGRVCVGLTLLVALCCALSGRAFAGYNFVSSQANYEVTTWTVNTVSGYRLIASGSSGAGTTLTVNAQGAANPWTYKLCLYVLHSDGTRDLASDMPTYTSNASYNGNFTMAVANYVQPAASILTTDDCLEEEVTLGSGAGAKAYDWLSERMGCWAVIPAGNAVGTGHYAYFTQGTTAGYLSMDFGYKSSWRARDSIYVYPAAPSGGSVAASGISTVTVYSIAPTDSASGGFTSDEKGALVTGLAVTAFCAVCVVAMKTGGL
jgi:hypothetical protein